MRLFISLFKYFPYGGLQKDTLRFAGEAARRGHEVTIFVTSWAGAMPDTDGIRVEIAPRLRAWTNTGRMDEFGKAACRRLAGGGFDVTLAMNRLPGHDFYFAADSCMKRYLPQHHCRLWRWLSRRCHAILRQEAAIFAPPSRTRVLYIADAQREEFAAEYAVEPERLIALPPGMDEACLPPASAEARLAIRRRCRETLKIADGQLLLITAGNSFVRKGMDRVIAALSALPPQWRRRCRVCLVGGFDECAAKKSIRRHGLPDDAVICLPARPDIGELLLAADLMVHPAREEGTGTVLVEALANGLPVVCTALCGFSPYVASSGGIALPSPFSQPELNEAVERALECLPRLREHAAGYAATQDFCARSRAAIDIMEASCRK